MKTLTEKLIKIGMDYDSKNNLKLLSIIHQNKNLFNDANWGLKESKELMDKIVDDKSVVLNSYIVDEVNSTLGENTLVEISKKETKNVFVTNNIDDLNCLVILKTVIDYYSTTMVDGKNICDDFLMNSIPRELDVDLITDLETNHKCKFEVII